MDRYNQLVDVQKQFKTFTFDTPDPSNGGKGGGSTGGGKLTDEQKERAKKWQAAMKIQQKIKSDCLRSLHRKGFYQEGIG